MDGIGALLVIYKYELGVHWVFIGQSTVFQMQPVVRPGTITGMDTMEVVVFDEFASRITQEISLKRPDIRFKDIVRHCLCMMYNQQLLGLLEGVCAVDPEGNFVLTLECAGEGFNLRYGGDKLCGGCRQKLDPAIGRSKDEELIVSDINTTHAF
ncbi:hypothetical protein B0H14DRAFT_2569737 [Mycena olivaceomarginata]|nr:hypothetical protein B0H14DRAFT_2569737 [Mycena olivaceomarginata]